jgi:hypothetical protein
MTPEKQAALTFLAMQYGPRTLIVHCPMCGRGCVFLYVDDDGEVACGECLDIPIKDRLRLADFHAALLPSEAMSRPLTYNLCYIRR